MNIFPIPRGIGYNKVIKVLLFILTIEKHFNTYSLNSISKSILLFGLNNWERGYNIYLGIILEVGKGSI
jgi:hypothetical protein